MEAAFLFLMPVLRGLAFEAAEQRKNVAHGANREI